VPNRDTLLVTGSEDHAGLAVMASLAEPALQEGWPVSGLALRLEGDSWVPFLPPPGHPHHRAFKSLGCLAIGEEYNRQKEHLDARHAERGVDLFVASYAVLRGLRREAVWSASVWTEGVDTLLPRTDTVWFVGGEKPDVLAAAPWVLVREVAGDLMEPFGGYPERYRVRAFPSPEQLEVIRQGESDLFAA
jgi:hypothetical protein